MPTTTAPRDHYAALGVPRSATSREVHRAFRHRARRLHPDVRPDADEQSAERYAALTAAHRVLSDRSLRAAHDEELGIEPMRSVGTHGAVGAAAGGVAVRLGERRTAGLVEALSQTIADASARSGVPETTAHQVFRAAAASVHRDPEAVPGEVPDGLLDSAAALQMAKAGFTVGAATTPVHERARLGAACAEVIHVVGGGLPPELRAELDRRVPPPVLPLPAQVRPPATARPVTGGGRGAAVGTGLGFPRWLRWVLWAVLVLLVLGLVVRCAVAPVSGVVVPSTPLTAPVAPAAPIAPGLPLGPGAVQGPSVAEPPAGAAPSGGAPELPARGAPVPDADTTAVGSCVLDGVDDAGIGPCPSGEAYRIYLVTELPDGAWPGRPAVAGVSAYACEAGLGDQELSWSLWSPTEVDWAEGDRTLVCAAWSATPVQANAAPGTPPAVVADPDAWTA